MKYQEFIPGDALKPYIKCYYMSESDSDLTVEDTAFATGCLELMFNLGDGHWELWGQVIRPMAFQTSGKGIMLGIRFYPHTASLFLNDTVSMFNDQVTDFSVLAGKTLRILQERLIETSILEKRLELVETFLLERLYLAEKKLNKLPIITSVMNELKHDDFFDNMQQLAFRYGMTERYLQKLFVQYTGLSPKLFHKINRFQKSLVLVSKKDVPLTSIAYECGYFDQSHFIRDFRFFTGLTPSAIITENSSAILASPYR